jgi:hypothetical protein
MKSFTISCLVIFMVITFSEFSQSQNIFATVDGNIVTLSETGTQRNCGALYEMTVNLDDHYMKWVQLDSGLSANCLCVFDLSVTYGPLAPGDYTVDVYYTFSFEPGEIFEGSTSFTIGGYRNFKDGGIISQYQSDCYSGEGIADSDGAGQDSFKLYPVPLKDGELLHLEVTPSAGKAVLEIFTLNGKLVYSKEYEGNQLIRDRFVKDELFPVSGIYIVRLKTPDNVFARKLTVL